MSSETHDSDNEILEYFANRLERGIKSYIEEFSNIASVESANYILDYHRGEDDDFYFNIIFESMQTSLNFRMNYEEGFRNVESTPIRDFEVERVSGSSVQFRNIMEFLSGSIGAVDTVVGDKEYSIIVERQDY